MLDYRQWYGKPLPYLIVLLAVVLIQRLLEPALLAWGAASGNHRRGVRVPSLLAYWRSPGWLRGPCAL